MPQPYILCILFVLLAPSIAFAQNATIPSSFEDADPPHVQGITPPNDSIGPVGNTGAKYKFDVGFYQRIQTLTDEIPMEGDPGVYDGKRYYDVILVASRDNMYGQNPDQATKENKDVIVEKLKTLGARDIVAAETLSFVTAAIPVANIPGFSLYNEVYKLGDGEMIVTNTIDVARNTIHATKNQIISTANNHLDGRGVTVAVIDAGINHTHAFKNRVIEKTFCLDGACNNDPTHRIQGYDTNKPSHGTQVAQVLAASGLEKHNGIAPGVQLLDVVRRTATSNGTISGLAHALDWSLRYGADIVNMSFGTVIPCDHSFTLAYRLIVNEAVDKGMVLVGGTGNSGLDDKNSIVYGSVSDPGCSHNVITTGGISDRGSDLGMYAKSSRGPIKNSIVLKPDLVAPGSSMQVLNHIDPDGSRRGVISINSGGGGNTSPASGTSLAVPQVSATAALLLQAKPELTPVQVKSALLLGATWMGPIPCTSSQYEENDPDDGCSYARQPTDLTASNPASLEILNNVGLGILNTADSLKYALSDSTHIASDYLDSNTASKTYKFRVTDTSQPVKIILTWLAHPHGSIIDQNSRNRPNVEVANLDFTMRDPDGIELTTSGDSMKQINEFAVFYPAKTGVYTVTVTGSNIDKINKPVQRFALASTNPFFSILSQSNHPPVAKPQEVLVSPGIERAIRLSGTDVDGDAISFHVSKDPSAGTVSTDEPINNKISRVLYTANSEFITRDKFIVTPHDGITTGTPATIRLLSESLPSGATDGTHILNIRDRDTFSVTDEFTHERQSMEFPGKSYSVSKIRLGSTNMESAEAEIHTTAGTYKIAIPSTGSRILDFATPITIQSVDLSAAAIEEEAVHDANKKGKTIDAEIYIDYMSAVCGSGRSSLPACPSTSNHRIMSRPNLDIPDNLSSQSTTTDINVIAKGALQAISVTLDISHTSRGDLRVVLRSPEGREATLHDLTGGSSNNIRSTYTLSDASLKSLVGAEINGDWTLSIGDYNRGNTGTLNSWSMFITYTPISTSTPSVTTHPPIFTDSFETGLGKWIETGERDWRITLSSVHSVPTLPGHPRTNQVLHADACRLNCIITMEDSLDLTQYSSAILTLDRFVDAGLESGEYLKAEAYDGSSWDTIYEWTNRHGGDGRWGNERYDLGSYLGVSDFKLRFVTKLSSSIEDVEVDNVRISASKKAAPTPPASSSGVTFEADLNRDRSRITVLFSESISRDFQKSDFELSHGAVTSVTNFDNSDIRYLKVSGIPFDTSVKVKYSGTVQALSTSGTTKLQPGSAATTNIVSDPNPPVSGRINSLISDDFESSLILWTLSGDGRWNIGSPHMPVPGQSENNHVLRSADCDSVCTATLKIPLDSTYPMIIEFDRFVNRDIKRDEGLTVEYSTDSGASWNALISLGAADKEDNHEWVHESFLTDAPGPMMVRLVANSHGDRDYIEIDNFAARALSSSDSETITRANLGFEASLRHWTVISDTTYFGTGIWESGSPRQSLSGASTGNKVMTSSDCDIWCSATLNFPIDTTSPVLVEFDMYVDREVRRGEGLYVEYSIDDGTSWTTLASFTSYNDEDNSVWTDKSLTLDIPQDSAMLRMTAKSNSPLDRIEIDNLVIRSKPDPNATLDTIRFTATLESESKILLRSSGFASKTFTPSDFEISSGTITSVTAASSYVLNLGVSEILYDTPITVTYTGERNLQGNPAYYGLYPGTVAITNTISRPDLPPTLSEISNVTMYHTETTTIRVTSEDPEDDAILLLLDDPPVFASITDYSNGTGDITLDPDITDIGTHTVTVRATATVQSDHASFAVTVLEPDTEPPVITAPPDIVTEATDLLTVVNIGNPTVTDDADPNPRISNDAPDMFPVGTAIITWNATDSTGKTATDTQTITIRDTTAPVINITGDNPIQHEVYTDYEDAGAVCNDNTNDDKPADTDTSVINEYSLGAYNVTYACTDSYNNTSTKTRTVNVSDTTKPRIALKGVANVTHFEGNPYADKGAWCKDNFDRTRHINADNTIDVDMPGLQILRYNCTDFFGNAALEKIRNVIVIPDIVPPVITAPQDIAQEAVAPLTPVNLGNATVSDDRDPTPSVSNDAPDGFPVGTTIVTWTVRDRSNNTSTDSQSITIQDTTKPIFSELSSSVTHTTSSFEGTAVTFDLSNATDTADPVVTVTSSHKSGDLFPVGNTTVTFIATDDSGNMVSHSIVITVMYDPPSIIQNLVLVPTHNSIAASWDHFRSDSEYRVKIFPEDRPNQKLAFDYNDTAHIFTGLEPDTQYSFAIHVKNARSTVVQTTVTTLSAQTRTSTDSTVFMTTLPDVTMTHKQTRVIPVTFEDPENRISIRQLNKHNIASLQDYENGTAAITINPSKSQLGTHEIIIGATAGTKSFIASLTVTVLKSDTTPPALVAPQNITLEATAPLTPISIGTATATDNVDPNPSIHNDAPSAFSVGTTIITWAAHDSSDNISTASQTITIQDTTPPVFSGLPSSVTYTVKSPKKTIIPFDRPNATDIADADVQVTSSHNLKKLFPVGNTTVTFTAADDSGNEISRNVTIIIRYDSSAMIQNTVLVPTHNSITASWDPYTSNSTYRVKIFPEGMHNYRLAFSYNHTSHTFTGLESSTEYRIVLRADSDESTLVQKTVSTLPAPSENDMNSGNTASKITPSEVTVVHAQKRIVPVTFEISGNAAVSIRQLSAYDLATIQDHKNGTAILVIDPKTSHIGTHKIFIGAIAGSESVFTSLAVIVLESDITAPVIRIMGDNPIYHEVYADYEDAGAVCNDNTNDDKPADADTSKIDAHMPGQYNVTYTCTDSSGNTSTKTRTVNILDTTKPVITLKGIANITHYLGDPYKDEGAWCKDNFDHTRHIESDDILDIGELAYQTLHYNCEDFAGNHAVEKTRIVTVVSDMPPVITTPQDITLEATAPLTPISIGNATVTDDRDPDPVISNNSTGSFPVGTTIIVWTATDNYNNTSTDTQTVTVQDTTKPIFTNLPPSATYTAKYTYGLRISFDIPNATDAVDPDVPVTSSHISGSLFPVGNTTVTFTAIDDSNNTATHEIVITMKPAPKFKRIIDFFHDRSGWSARAGMAETIRSAHIPHNHAYSVGIDTSLGRPAPSYKISGMGSNAYTVVWKTYDISNLGNYHLFFGLDIFLNKQYMEPAGNGRFYAYPEIRVSFYTADFEHLYSYEFNPRKNWTIMEEKITQHVQGHDSIVVALFVVDYDIFDRYHQVNFDNLYLGTTPPYGVWYTTDPIIGNPLVPVPDKPHEPLYDAMQTESPLGFVSPTTDFAELSTELPFFSSPLVISFEEDQHGDHEVHTAHMGSAVRCEDDAGMVRQIDADMSRLDINMIGQYPVSYSCVGFNTTRIAYDIINVVDTTNPSISLKGTPVVEHPNGVQYIDAGATCADNYDSDRYIDTHDIIDVYEPGPQTLHYTCIDSSENKASDKVRIVIVLKPGEEPLRIAPPVDQPQNATIPESLPQQQEAPQITAPPAILPPEPPSIQNATLMAPPDITLEATGQLTIVPLGKAIAPTTTLNITNNAPDMFPLGVTIITWTVIDSYNYTHTANQTITIQDTTPPVFSGLPQSSTHTTESDGVTVEFEMPTASDLVDSDVTISSSHDSGSIFPIGNTTVIFTATDDSENMATYNMVITVKSSLPTGDPKQEPEPEPKESAQMLEEPPVEPEPSEQNAPEPAPEEPPAEPEPQDESKPAPVQMPEEPPAEPEPIEPNQ